MWGEVQAERYLGFLRELFATLAEKPSLAATIEERPELLIFTARYRKRRTSHGHRIIFREIDNGIEIIRILHTAMYWPNYIP
jgi:plasmid stabilization system protein ParE